MASVTTHLHGKHATASSPLTNQVWVSVCSSISHTHTKARPGPVRTVRSQWFLTLHGKQPWQILLPGTSSIPGAQSCMTFG